MPLTNESLVNLQGYRTMKLLLSEQLRRLADRFTDLLRRNPCFQANFVVR